MSGEEVTEGIHFGPQNRRIEASRALAAPDGVPERNAVVLERLDPFRIRRIRREAEELSHHRPEAVSRVRIVGAGFERRFARHAAEDEHARIRIGRRREPIESTARLRHGRPG